MDGARSILMKAQHVGHLGKMPIEEQVEHSIGFGEAVERRNRSHPSRFGDLGSGGGVPALVLAERWSSASAVLIDSNERRVEFLRSEIDHWGRGDRIEVLLMRAELVGRQIECRESFPVVTARSFAPPAVTAECGAPLLELGGLLVVSEPPDVDGPSRWKDESLSLLGLRRIEQYRHRGLFTYQLLEKVAPISDRYPRRVGVPAKRPMF